MQKKCTVNLGSPVNLTMQNMICIYKSGDGQMAHATYHDVYTDGQGRNIPLPGAALTHATIANLVSQFSNNAQVGSFLPITVLSVGLDSLVWWVKPCSRRVFFRCSSNGIGEESAVVPHPGLVFAVRNGSWHVFAVKGESRPEADTPLYQAPHFNVWEGGKICVGNVDIPKGYSVETMGRWEDAYFNSVFTHPNVHTVNGLVNFKGGSYAFWREMLDGKYSQFPEEVLVEGKRTVAELIAAVTAGGLK